MLTNSIVQNASYLIGLSDSDDFGRKVLSIESNI